MKVFGPFDSIHVCRVGERIELSPHLDRWMMGDRYGEVVGFARLGFRYDPILGTERPYWPRCKPEKAEALAVKMDVSGKVIRIKADGIGALIR